MPKCWERIAEASERNDSRICIGLDVDPEKFPVHLRGAEDAIYSFNRQVIDATLDLVCCYKPNLAFYEALGFQGLNALSRTITYLRGRAPVILDAKRGDIGNTAERYALAAFEWMGADAVTVSPYMGHDSVEPFLKYEDKGVFVLCLTSNPGAADFQFAPEGEPLYERVARKVLEWDRGRGQLGLVVGATRPEHVGRLRSLAGELPFLLPGIGAQGGSLGCVAAAGLPSGAAGPAVIVNASRSVIYAGEGKDFAKDVRTAAESLRRLVGGPAVK